MISLAFRSAQDADVDVIVALVESTYRGEGSRRGWTTEVDLLDGQRTDAFEVSDLIARPDSRVLLGERNGRVVTCCHLEKQGSACYFGLFSVVPELQGGGVGREVLAEAERVARDEWSCRTMMMTVIDVRAELIAWYERRGYRRTGETKPFPYGDPRFGLPRREDLRFEVLVKELPSARA